MSDKPYQIELRVNTSALGIIVKSEHQRIAFSTTDELRNRLFLEVGRNRDSAFILGESGLDQTNLPEGAKDKIHYELLRSVLRRVKLPKHFFSDEQNKQLKDYLDKNNTFFNKIYARVFAIIGIIAGALLTMIGLTTMTVGALTGATFGYGLGYFLSRLVSQEQGSSLQFLPQENLSEKPYSAVIKVTGENSRAEPLIRFRDKYDLAQKIRESLSGVPIKSFELLAHKKNHLPNNASALFVGALQLQEHQLKSVIVPEGFWPPEREVYIKCYLRDKTSAKDRRLLERQNSARIRLRGTAVMFGVAVSAFLKHSLSRILLSVFSSILFVALLNIVRKKSFSRVSYRSEKTINQASQREKDALNAGVEALTWKGYFSSFGNRAAWRHPVAFLSGLNHAERENGELVSCIKKAKLK